MIRAVLAYLRQPDAYPDDWYRWVGGQAGHAAIIGAPLCLPLLGAGIPAVAAPVIVAAAYWLIWEVLIQRGADWRDSLSDATHVGAGAALMAAALAGAPPEARAWTCATVAGLYLIWLAMLIAGIRKRIGAGND